MFLFRLCSAITCSFTDVAFSNVPMPDYDRVFSSVYACRLYANMLLFIVFGGVNSRILSCDGMSSKTPLIAVITIVSFSFERPPTDQNGV